MLLEVLTGRMCLDHVTLLFRQDDRPAEPGKQNSESSEADLLDMLVGLSPASLVFSGGVRHERP